MLLYICTQNGDKGGAIMRCNQLIKHTRYLTVDGQKIKIARTKKNWTITRLAEHSGVTRKTIS